MTKKKVATKPEPAKKMSAKSSRSQPKKVDPVKSAEPSADEKRAMAIKELSHEIAKKQKECRDAEADYLEQKAKATTARKFHDARMKELGKMLDRLANLDGGQGTLFTEDDYVREKHADATDPDKDLTKAVAANRTAAPAPSPASVKSASPGKELMTVPICKLPELSATASLKKHEGSWIVSEVSLYDSKGPTAKLKVNGSWTETVPAVIAAAESLLQHLSSEPQDAVTMKAMAEAQAFRRKQPGCEKLSDFVPTPAKQKRPAKKQTGSKAVASK